MYQLRAVFSSKDYALYVFPSVLNHKTFNFGAVEVAADFSFGASWSKKQEDQHVFLFLK